MSKIIAGYNANAWWSWLQGQVQANKKLGADKVFFPFMSGLKPPPNTNPYLALYSEGETEVLVAQKFSRSFEEPLQPSGTDDFLLLDKIKLLYHINRMKSIHHLCIFLSVTLDNLMIAYGKKHLGFSYCYKIIICSWFIQGLTKMLWAFIYHWPQCLALQTRWDTFYNFLQLIESRFIPFFTLILDFVLAIWVSAKVFNSLMSVTCKFSKSITLIKEINM